jgi:hypothetical protein
MPENEHINPDLLKTQIIEYLGLTDIESERLNQQFEELDASLENKLQSGIEELQNLSKELRNHQNKIPMDKFFFTAISLVLFFLCIPVGLFFFVFFDEKRSSWDRENRSLLYRKEYLEKHFENHERSQIKKKKLEILTNIIEKCFDRLFLSNIKTVEVPYGSKDWIILEGDVIDKLSVEITFPNVRECECLFYRSVYFENSKNNVNIEILPDVYVSLKQFKIDLFCDFRKQRSFFGTDELKTIFRKLKEYFPLIPLEIVRIRQWSKTKEYTFSLEDLGSDEAVLAYEEQKSNSSRSSTPKNDSKSAPTGSTYKPSLHKVSDGLYRFCPLDIPITSEQKTADRLTSKELNLPQSFKRKPITLLSEILEKRKNTEDFAMAAVMAFERQQGRNPVDVSSQNLGYDIESIGNSDSLQQDTRLIEVKGLGKSGDVIVTKNEYNKALSSKNYYFYIVDNIDSANYQTLFIISNCSALKFENDIVSYSVNKLSIDTSAQIKRNVSL